MTSATPVFVFANPIAGRGKGKTLAKRIADRLRRGGFDARIVLERPAEATLDRDTLLSAKAIVSIGGDGTLRAVAQRLHDECADACPPLLVIPMGTANLMGRHLELHWNPAKLDELELQVLDAIRRGRTERLDAATCNGKLFLLMAGVGIDATIVHELDRIRSGPIRYASYVIPAALTLAAYDYPPIRVTVDGKPIAPREPAIAFVANIKEYGTGFPLLPDAVSTDGLLDVIVLRCRNRGEALQHLLYAASGEHVQQEGVVYVRGKRVTIEAEEPVPVQVDGDSAGFTPATIEVLPGRVPFIVTR